MEEEWADILADCRQVINESINELMSIEADYTEDTVEPVVLQHLHDMAEDVAEAGRIRRAEANLAWRRAI